MEPSSRDRLSVDLHGLKAALHARAATERVSVSVVVRRAIERELGLADGSCEQAASKAPEARRPAATRLSIRLASAVAAQVDAAMRGSGLSRGDFIADLLASPAVPSSNASGRLDRIAALTASCAELATLSRDVRQLVKLLRQGDARAAQEYRRMLDTLGDDVRKHLRLAAELLADLRPSAGAHAAARRPTT